ncbi:Dyp-type peroxidase [Streptosporangium subroseum]|uniref:Dyp-type peroxidase n=1 Tax=Streptosporangium subroseum TaxID=106412 RepID=UPI00308C2DBE|nr:Dyp-type peroxidase [Streptosporangium subroseum]
MSTPELGASPPSPIGRAPGLVGRLTAPRDGMSPERTATLGDGRHPATQDTPTEQVTAPDGGPGAVTRRGAMALGGLAAVCAMTAADSGDEPAFAAADVAPLPAALLPPAPHVVLTALDVPPGADAVRSLAELARLAREPGGGARAAIALGSSWFDKAGLAASRPLGLTPMPSFVGEVLDAALVHGDLLLQVSAVTAELARQVSGSLLRAVPGAGVRWEKRGFRAGSRLSEGRALARNLFGFVEGHGNPSFRSSPDAAEVACVAAGSGEPRWAVGGSYQVIRIVRFATRLWDLEPVPVQERVMGRRRDGTWLDGTRPTGRPVFDADPEGRITPLDAHTRRANPGTPGVAAPRMLRRGYSYHDGPEDQGMLFMAFQGDLELGFAGVQRRLAGQSLDRYMLTVGGGYYFLPDLSHGTPVEFTV